MRLASLLAVASLLFLGSCSECDDITQCEDACDEQYQGDDPGRSACYNQCLQAQQECQDPNREVE